MRGSLKTALFLAIASLHGGAQAQIYMCKDASGRTITSDRPIPECADRVVREFDKSGRIRRDIPPPMTAEQKRQIQLEEERRKAEEAAADEQRRNDRLLRSRYRSEGDIEAARKRSVEPAEDRVRHEKAVLATNETQRQQAQAEADALREKNAPVSPALQRRLDDALQSIGSSTRAIDEHEAEIAHINTKFDALLQRYRELNGMPAMK